MIYDLAKELKDAGFPLKSASVADDKYGAPWFSYGRDSLDRIGTWLYPTLSELIEACGDVFIGLHKRDKNTWIAYSGLWVNGEMGINIEVIAHTAEEAVARLFLAIKNK